MAKYTETSLRRRTRVFLVAVLCVITIISGRLFYIQLIASNHLRFLAAEQWYRDLPLMAERGRILDARGRIMAESVLTYSIYIRPIAITDPNRVADVLSAELGMNRQLIYNKATNRRVSEWLIRMQVSKQVTMNIVSHNIDGIFVSQTFNRTYPMGATGGQILGLVSIDGFGQSGIEAFYNHILMGQHGRVATPSDLRGVPRDDGRQFFSRPIAGFDVKLNVDTVIQGILQSALEKALYEQGATSVSGLVMDIQTGGIVASGAAPFFDMNNQPRDNVIQLMEQIKNLPIVNVLEPGSTFKILTLAIALELGLTHEGELFQCPGFRMIGGERVKCWRTRGHGTMTLVEGVLKSCNCVFMDLALRIGVDRFYQHLRLFGIGEKTGVDFHGESRGLVLPKQYIRPVDLARIGFGHAVAVSPIQLQAIVSAIVGGGELRTPRFAQSIPNVGVNIVSETKRRIVSAETSERVRNMMIATVNEGSGKHAGVNGFHIGGKTGTAQKYRDGIIDQGKYISSFTGFLSVNGVPRYSVMFLVDEPSKMGYYGSIVAAPYVGQIFALMINYLQLVPDPSVLRPNMQEVVVPSLAGRSLVESVALLRTLGFFVQVSGDGGTVGGTHPAAGTTLARGSPVVLRTVG